jgi:hypothetical protein
MTHRLTFALALVGVGGGFAQGILALSTLA